MLGERNRGNRVIGTGLQDIQNIDSV